MTANVSSIAALDHPAAIKGAGLLGRVLLLWYLAVMFTVFSLQFGDLKVSCFFALPAALVMLARNMSSASQKEMMLLGLLLFVALLSVVVGTDADFIDERAKSFLLFGYSLLMAYALRLELGRATRADVSWTSGWLLVVILAGAILEVLGPLKPISDAFRAQNENETFIYSADLRDLTIAGFIRPSVFTAEPSYVAIGVAVFSFVWFVSTRSRYRVVMFGLATVLTLYLVRSPISAIALPSVVLVLLASVFRRSTGSQRVERIYITLTAMVLAIPVAYVAFRAVFAARRLSGGVSGDGSLVVRLIAPPRIAAAVLEESPFMGAGLGGREAILSQMHNVFIELRVLNALHHVNRVEVAIPNAFWEHWIYFGLFGGVLAGYAIVRYFRLLCGGNCLTAAIFLLLLANSLGAYTNPRFWSFATLVVIATALSREEDPGVKSQDTDGGREGGADPVMRPTTQY